MPSTGTVFAGWPTARRSANEPVTGAPRSAGTGCSVTFPAMRAGGTGRPRYSTQARAREAPFRSPCSWPRVTVCFFWGRGSSNRIRIRCSMGVSRPSSRSPPSRSRPPEAAPEPAPPAVTTTPRSSAGLSPRKVLAPAVTFSASRGVKRAGSDGLPGRRALRHRRRSRRQESTSARVRRARQALGAPSRARQRRRRVAPLTARHSAGSRAARATQAGSRPRARGTRAGQASGAPYRPAYSRRQTAGQRGCWISSHSDTLFSESARRVSQIRSARLARSASRVSSGGSAAATRATQALRER